LGNLQTDLLQTMQTVYKTNKSTTEIVHTSHYEAIALCSKFKLLFDF